jgi:SH3 domain-containing protein
MMPRAALWLALALAASVSHAETSYVIDQLVVGVSASSDAESERVGQVKSGDKLEVIERDGDQTHVKLANGKDGWLKSSYLTNEPPPQARLTERTAEVEKLKSEGEKLRTEGDKLKQDVTRLEAELAAARAAHNATSDAPQPPAPIHDTVFLREPERQSSTSWQVLLGVAGVMLLVGFIAGWTTLDRKIRQKYGGLKIY